MSVLQYPAERTDPHVFLKHELVTLQLETWLLEEWQAAVRVRLHHCRLRRAGLTRQYRHLVTATTSPERA
jgi:hypothetical protein